MVKDLKRARADDGETEVKRSKKVDGTPAKKRATASVTGPALLQDHEGNMYWELSNTRRVTVSSFKGKQLVNIREYFESAGQMRPGKKGISLNVDQYKKLAEAISQINKELGLKPEEEEEKETKDGEEKKKSKKSAEHKANIDQTSSEAED